MDADKITILVAEDDKDVKTLIEKELTSLGYITIVASSFLESKNLILNQGNKVDLFLVDIQLPDGDGFHLIQDIRQINPDAPVVIITGFINNKIVNKAVQNNCYDLIEKPFSIKEDIIPIIKRGLSPALLKKENVHLNEQIVHHSKLAALGELSATIIHDIRGPLALIQLTCEDIKDEFHQSNTISDKALLPHLGQIDKACLKIKKLVDQLRNYSRHDSKEVPENKDIKELIEESLFLVKQKLRTGNIKANVILEEKISQMTLLCYANKLEQVLMNLMSNACDAMKNLTKKELTIKAFMQDNYFLIAVQDTGTGIPDDIKPKIFESFYTTKPKGEGTGLGLSIVKNIVIEHGGDLLVDSEMGKGSTFTIKLPALKLSPLNKTDKIQAA